MRYILITTTTCQQCPPVKEFLYEVMAEIDIDITILDERTAGYMDVITTYDVVSAPSLVAISDEGACFIMNGEDEIRSHFTK